MFQKSLSQDLLVSFIRIYRDNFCAESNEDVCFVALVSANIKDDVSLPEIP